METRFALAFLVVFFLFSFCSVWAGEETKAMQTVSVDVTWNVYVFGDRVEGFKIYLRKKGDRKINSIVLKKGEYDWDFARYTLENLHPNEEYIISLSVFSQKGERVCKENVYFTSPRVGYVRSALLNLSPDLFGIPIEQDVPETVDVEIAWEHVNTKVDGYRIYVFDNSGSEPQVLDADPLLMEKGFLVYKIEGLNPEKKYSVKTVYYLNEGRGGADVGRSSKGDFISPKRGETFADPVVLKSTH